MCGGHVFQRFKIARGLDEEHTETLGESRVFRVGLLEHWIGGKPERPAQERSAEINDEYENREMDPRFQTGLSNGPPNCGERSSSAGSRAMISAAMAAETGARRVIAGHSERRHTIGRLEDDRMIHGKVRAGVGAGLTASLYVGEKLPQREAGERILLTIGCRSCL